MSSGDRMEVEITMSECPICSQKTTKLFTAPCDYRKPNNSSSHDVYWCSECCFGQVWKRPTKEEITSFYELDSYYTHQATTNKNGNHNGDESFLDRLRMHLAWRLDRGEELSPNDATPILNEGDSLEILEIGCGNGTNISKFIGKGFSAVGVEPDPKAREAAIKIGLVVYEGTAEDLPEAILGRKFDVVLMSHVLEHCLDINAAVANAKGMLKKGGIYIVETPNCGSLGFKEQKAEWPWSDIPRHLNFFTPYSLRSILYKHGFDVISEKYSGFCRQFSNSWLATEEEVWQSFRGCDKRKAIKPDFKLRAWKLLVRSLIASNVTKYDSVRIIAKNI
jgi:SAM-dependent methyltransferase